MNENMFGVCGKVNKMIIQTDIPDFTKYKILTQSRNPNKTRNSNKYLNELTQETLKR